MKLYYHPMSTYSQKVQIALLEKNVEVERDIVQLMDSEARDKYREVYPMGKIPLLVLGDGHIVPESSIIIEYLDSVAEPKLIFGEADLQRRIRFKDRMFDLYLNESVVTLLFQSMKPETERDAERVQAAEFRIATMYRFMEHEFGQQPFGNGDTFSMSDCAAAPGLFYAERVAPFAQHANISAYWERLQSRPSIAAVFEEAQPYVEAFMSRAA